MKPLLVAIAVLLLGACGSSSNEPASGASAADVKGTAKDVQAAEVASPPEVMVGASGYGAVQFGMAKEEADQAAKAPLGKSAIENACEPKGAPVADVVYLFPDGKLQAIAVHSSSVMAEGGGHVGMDADEIRTLYAGKIKESPLAGVAGGHVLKVTGFRNDAGLLFFTDAAGKVTAFRAGVGPALEGAGCTGA